MLRGSGSWPHSRDRLLTLRGGKKVEYSTDFDDERIQKALLKNAAGKRGRRSKKGLAPLKTPLQIGSLVRGPQITAKKSREEVEEEERRRAVRERQRRDAIWRQMGVTNIEELQMVMWRAAEEGDQDILASCVAAGADVNFNYTDVPQIREVKKVDASENTAKDSHEDAETLVIQREEDPRSTPRSQILDLRSPPLTVNSRGELKDSQQDVGAASFAQTQETAEHEQLDDKDDEGMYTSEDSDYNKGVNATAMHIAARNNHSGVIARLAHLGAVVDARTVYCTTPLMTAAHRGSTEAAVALVKLGADVFKQDISNMTSAELAERYAADWRISLWLRQVMAWTQSEEKSRGEPMPLPFKPGEFPHPNHPGVWTFQRNWMSAPTYVKREDLAREEDLPQEMRNNVNKEDLGFRMQPADERDVKEQDWRRQSQPLPAPRLPPPPPPRPPPPPPQDIREGMMIHPSRASF